MERKGGRRRARRDAKRRKRDINRSDARMQTKGLMESAKECRETEKKRSYCKQVEPPVPPVVHVTDLAKALSFPSADSITFSHV